MAGTPHSFPDTPRTPMQNATNSITTYLRTSLNAVKNSALSSTGRHQRPVVEDTLPRPVPAGAVFYALHDPTLERFWRGSELYCTWSPLYLLQANIINCFFFFFSFFFFLPLLFFFSPMTRTRMVFFLRSLNQVNMQEMEPPPLMFSLWIPPLPSQNQVAKSSATRGKCRAMCLQIQSYHHWMHKETCHLVQSERQASHQLKRLVVIWDRREQIHISYESIYLCLDFEGLLGTINDQFSWMQLVRQ